MMQPFRKERSIGMKIYRILLVLLVLSWIPYAAAAEKNSEVKPDSKSETNIELKPQETCPIMGGKINKDLYVDANGKRIYACCSACLPKIQKDPEAALKKLAEKGEYAESLKTKPQETCPIMGRRINKGLYVDVNGQRIYACCSACLPKIQKDPEAALKKLAEKGEHAESLQTTCPVMGGKINKDLFVEYEGRRIYVCCPACLEEVKKDPAKYAKKLAEPADKKPEAGKAHETGK